MPFAPTAPPRLGEEACKTIAAALKDREGHATTTEEPPPADTAHAAAAAMVAAQSDK